jgi:ATP-dependent Clp protease, protease subunit
MTTLDRLKSIQNTYARKLGAPESIVARAGDDGTILLYREIGSADWGGISSEEFAKALDKVRDAKRIHLRVNSIGGVVFEAKAMLTLFREAKAEKIVHVDGLAASAATIVAMGGDRIITAPEATWFIHPAMAIGIGNADDFRSLANVLDRETGTIIDLYAKRTKQPVDEIKKWIYPESEMTAEVALARGFTDEIEGGAPARGDAKAVDDRSPFVNLANETQRRVNIERLNRLRDRASPSASPASRDNHAAG